MESEGKGSCGIPGGQGTCQGPDSFLIVEFVAKIHAAKWIIFSGGMN
jgi:hypothetical protein